MMFTKRIRRILLQPSLWTAIVAVVAYCDEQAMNGKFVYDDNGSIKSNVVVSGKVPFREILTRDYWGAPMSDNQSHKSFRPITTASFRLNWILSEKLGTNGTDTQTYGFHVVNVGLHGIVTGMFTHAAGYVLDGDTQSGAVAQLIAGFLFALHPVHAEVTSNLTSRGELLMTFFSLTAFISFARHNSTASVKENTPQSSGIGQMFGIYIFPWVCMILSLFSKEQGATTLMSLVVFDLVINHDSFSKLWQDIRQGHPRALGFVKRSVVLAVQTVLVCGFRYWLNGETSPDFIADQNPAGFARDHFTRIFSVNWVYCLYIRDMLLPNRLGPDWSGASIPLIQDIHDTRVWVVLCLWAHTAAAAWSLCAGLSPSATKGARQVRRIALIAFWGFTVCPFLLSSNLLVVVGLMKADRVLYSPLMGFCLLEALAIKIICFNAPSGKQKQRSAHIGLKYWGLYAAFLLQMGLFSSKLHERNVAWSDSLNLWMRAYQINNASYHTMYNCGYELSLQKRYEEAEHVLRPIGDPRIDGPSNTFVYAMVLYNLNRCAESKQLVNKAIEVITERRALGGPRNTEASLNRVESNLMVALAFCTSELTEAGRIMYEAVHKDPTNEYAIQQATNMVNFIQQQTTVNEQKKRSSMQFI